jgi:hypothetical protein
MTETVNAARLKRLEKCGIPTDQIQDRTQNPDLKYGVTGKGAGISFEIGP